MQKNQKGFSLLELLVVVAIMLVIASIAIPAVISSIQASNEASATSTMKTVVTAESGYYNLAHVYSAKALYLGSGGTSACPNAPDTANPPLGSCMIADAVSKQLDAGILSGYGFLFAQTATGWTLSATPTSTSTGRR